MDSSQIGARVRYWRLRRGLSHAQLSARLDRSVSWLEKIESGQRALARLPMLSEVATALGITVEALVDPAAAGRAIRQPDPVEVAAIRGALGSYEVLLGGPPHPANALGLAELSRRVAYLNTAFLASNFAVIGRQLPGLIIAAQHAMEIDAVDPVPAVRMTVQTYRVASSVLLKLGANETAWLAADRAIFAAQRVSDSFCLARATRSIARAMTSLGQCAAALDALLAVVRRLEPVVSAASDDVAAMYGMLLLAAEIAAAKLDDSSTVEGMHNEAARIAESRFAGSNDATTAFGPTNVLLHRVSAYVRLGDGDVALNHASRLDRQAVELLPRERRSNLLLDIATAYHQMGDHRQAVAALLRADRLAPDEVRCRPSSRTLVRELANHPACTPNIDLRRLAKQAGVTA
jgi:transcriptional regulator with XRE-family HTH domain